MKYASVIFLIVFFTCSSSRNSVESNVKVGTKSFRWVDPERIDEQYGGNRLINVQVWYPIDPLDSTSNISRAPYYYEIDNAYDKLDNWSELDYQSVSKIQSNSIPNHPISKNQSSYPVLLLSPSLGGNISQYTYYAEHLAKSGFVVVGVNHLYESEYVLDAKMNVFPVNVVFHDSLKTLDIPKEITADRYREVKGVRQIILGQDLVFCLDQLGEINPSEFNGQLDLQNIGAFGHSLGGAAAIFASILDNRFDAILNIDGTPPSVALSNGIKVPFMFIEDLTDYNNHPGYKKMHLRRSSFCEINSTDSYRILMAGINHNSFLDLNYQIARSNNAEESVPDVLIKTAKYMNLFFSQYLKSVEMNLPEIKTDSLEIIHFAKN